MTYSVLFFVILFGFSGSENCESIRICEGMSQADPSIDWAEFSHLISHPLSPQSLLLVGKKFGSNPAVVRECRMGLASGFFRLGKSFLPSNPQRAHDMNQLAMAMVWDLSRSHLACLEKEAFFGVLWLTEFMEEYLGLAGRLERHEDRGLPPPSVSHSNVKRVRPEKIAIATVCDYADPSHPLFGIEKLSLENRKIYSSKFGYDIVFMTESAELTGGRHPVWSAMALPLRLLQLSPPKYEYVMWMDCDALFIDLNVRIEDLIALHAEKDLIISEDGRGLSGGNWIIKNTDWSRNFLRSLINNPAFDKYDLKDQFGILWSLLGPGTWSDNYDLESTRPWGYPSNIALLPQRLINAYPYAFCRPSHHCFEDGRDFIVSFITLGSQSRVMAWHLLLEFAHRVDPNASFPPHR